MVWLTSSPSLPHKPLFFFFFLQLVQNYEFLIIWTWIQSDILARVFFVISQTLFFLSFFLSGIAVAFAKLSQLLATTHYIIVGITGLMLFLPKIIKICGWYMPEEEPSSRQSSPSKQKVGETQVNRYMGWKWIPDWSIGQKHWAKMGRSQIWWPRRPICRYPQPQWISSKHVTEHLHSIC